MTKPLIQDLITLITNHAFLKVISPEAILRSHAQIRTLIENGANVNAVVTSDPLEELTGLEGWTILMIAARHGDKEIIRILVENGADIRAVATSGLCEGMNALTIAARYGDKEKIDTLIECGADVNAVVTSGPNIGLTALMIAAKWRKNDRVKALAEKVENINAVATCSYYQGMNALMIAVQYGDKENIDTLVEYGADVNVVITSGPHAGKKAFDLSVNNLEIAMRLIQYGAIVTDEDIAKFASEEHRKRLREEREEQTRKDQRWGEFRKEWIKFGVISQKNAKIPETSPEPREGSCIDSSDQDRTLSS